MKRVTAVLILSFMIIYFVAPFFGASNEKEMTDITTTKLYLNAGVERVMKDIISTKNETEDWKVGYTITSVNVRSNPSIDDNILYTYPFNTKVKYCDFNDEWVEILYLSETAYINSKYINDNRNYYIEYNVPYTSGYKSYMPHTSITSISSSQYILQTKAYTGNYGIRMIDDRYCVALGTGFNADIGTYIDLVLENGTVIKCIVGDIKADIHTDSNNMITVANGCLTEFIIDNSALDENAKRMGDISYCCDEWNSRVEKIRVYDKNVFEKFERGE